MKNSNLPPGVREFAISVIGLATLVGMLTIIDERVRQELVTAVTGGGVPAAAHAGTQVTLAGSTLLAAVRDQSFEHAPMTMLVVVAAVLVMCMLRT
jgi:hypothetical protein